MNAIIDIINLVGLDKIKKAIIEIESKDIVFDDVNVVKIYALIQKKKNITRNQLTNLTRFINCAERKKILDMLVQNGYIKSIKFAQKITYELVNM